MGTIKYLNQKISYIDEELSKKLSQAYSTRKNIVKDIFESKKQVLMFYSDLKESVEAKLSSVRTDEFAVEIDASFVIDRSFNGNFLKCINKKRRGYFHGANDPQNLLKTLVSEVNWNDFDSIYAFFGTIINNMSKYENAPISMSEQVLNAKEFYDFIFSLEYFTARYELRLGGKNLNL